MIVIIIRMRMTAALGKAPRLTSGRMISSLLFSLRWRCGLFLFGGLSHGYVMVWTNYLFPLKLHPELSTFLKGLA